MTKLTNERSIETILSEMTLDEKITLLTQKNSSKSQELEQYGIWSLMYDDGLAGINCAQLYMQYLSENPPRKSDGSVDKEKSSECLQKLFSMLSMSPAEIREAFPEDPCFLGMAEELERRFPDGKDFMAFPSGINVGASFSTETAQNIGQALGQEMRAGGIDVVYAPNADIMRNPLGGRNYEMFSEDTFHAAAMTAEYVKGVQSAGTAACVKHLIANNVETNRNTVNEWISHRVLREIYSQSFEAAVKEGGAKVVMSAYNAVNGVFSSYNARILTKMLKEDWGFQGYVVSDWGAVTEKKDRAIAAGLDMVTKGPNDMSEVKSAIQSGSLSEERINDAVRRILKVLIWLKKKRKETPARFDRKRVMQTAYDTVVDGTVLLKNEGNLLPLDTNRKVAFYGKGSRHPFEYGGGSTFINTRIHTNVLEESLKLGVRAVHEEMEQADVLVYSLIASSGEGADRADMKVDGEDAEKCPRILKEAKKNGIKTVVILNIAQPVDMREWLIYADAVYAIFVPGSMGGKAAADILFGKADPAGRLPVSFPVRYEDTPGYPYFPGDGHDMYYGEGVCVGYKYYDTKKIPVQYAFGYGLSYTTFEQRVAAEVLEMDLTRNVSLQIPVRVKNTGKRRGAQVIQLYLKEENPKLIRPEKELKAFVKVALEAGEEREVFLTLTRESFRVFDEDREEWMYPAGEYRLYMATSAAEEDTFAMLKLTVKCGEKRKIDRFSSMAEIMRNSEAARILTKHIPMLETFALHPEEIDPQDAMMNGPVKNMLPMLINVAIPDAVKGAELAEKIYCELEELK